MLVHKPLTARRLEVGGGPSIEQRLEYYRGQCACGFAMACGWLTLFVATIPQWATLQSLHDRIWTLGLLGLGSLALGTGLGKITGQLYYAVRIAMLLRRSKGTS